jgi:acyl carrier protein
LIGKNDPLDEATIVSPELHREIVGMFAEIFQIEIVPELKDFIRGEIDGWDSVNHLRLIAEIEEIFRISLSDEEVTRIASVRDVEMLLAERGIIYSVASGTSTR